MDSYLKQLESLISPRNFDIQFFRENKKEAPKEEVLLSNDDNKKLIEEYLRKMKDTSNNIVPKNLNENSQQNNEIKVNSELQKIEVNSKNKVNKKYSLSPKRKVDQSNTQSSPISKNSNKNEKSNNNNEDNDVESEMKQKIHEMNITNMNFRHEVTVLKSNIEEIERKIANQAVTIQKLEKQKENDSKYLVKLENLIAQENKQKSNININLNVSNHSAGMKINDDVSRSQQFSQEIASDIKNLMVNLNDKNEIKEFILNLFNENQKLKYFQSQVQEISKNYDLVNDNIIESMKSIQILIDQITKNEIFDNSQFNSLISYFENIIQYVQKTLEIKQNEYHFLTSCKEQDVIKMNEELVKIKNKVENLKQDRLRDQKIINKLEEQNKILKEKINEYIGRKTNLSNNIHVTVANKKLTDPIKSSMKNIVTRFEKNLNLQDKNNVKFLENLNGKIKQ